MRIGGFITFNPVFFSGCLKIPFLTLSERQETKTAESPLDHKLNRFKTKL